MNRRSLLAVLAFLLALVPTFLSRMTAAQAEEYPSRPITIIVPFPAGGPTDTVARIIGAKMQEILGATMIIENISGAGSTIGTTRAIQAEPDGYTLIVGNWTSHVGANVLYPVTWHIVNDLAPISRLSSSSLMIVGNAELQPKTMPDLIAMMKARPGRVTSANVGAGSGAHICMLNFMDKTGTEVQLVPYRGGAPAMQDLIAGNVDTFCGEASQTLASVRSGKVRAFAVMAQHRWGPLPDVPTMKELGFDLDIEFWHGLWAPKGTAPEIVAKLNDAAVKALNDTTVRKRIADLGQTIPPNDQLTPEALRKFHQAQIDKWWPIIKKAGIKIN